jgi:hypothetical protein
MVNRAIVLIIVAVSTSETSVNFYHTIRRNIRVDSRLHTPCHENPKSHDVTKCAQAFGFDSFL